MEAANTSENTKRVLYISVVHPLHDHRFIYKQCKGLAEAGFDVSYMNAKAEKEDIIEKTRVIPIRGSSTRFKRFLSTFLLLPYLLKSRHDVIHLVDPELLPVGVIIKLLTRKIIIFDAHEDYFSFISQKYYIKGISGKLIHWAAKATIYISSKILDGFVFADESTAEIFKMPQERKCIFYNFPSRSLFPEDISISWENRPYDLVLVGTMSKTSGIFVLLEATKILKERYPQIKLLLIGQVDENISSQVKLFIEQNNLTDNIEITGRIPHHEVPARLKKCKIGCISLLDLPKFHKNIATKLFEYMALGLPVVSADLPPERKYIKEGKTGLFFTPGDPQSMAEAIDKILSDKKLWAEMAANARRYMIENNLFAENEMAKLVEFYKRLLNYKQGKSL